MKVLLTGASGFLGHYLTREITDSVEKLYVLARPKSASILRDELSPKQNVEVIEGDLSQFDVITSDSERERVLSDIDVIVHGAAHYDLEADHSTCFLHNVVATQNLIALSEKVTDLKAFHYVSTVAVAGNYEGTLLESDLEVRQAFGNSYAKTKYEAEKIVLEHKFAHAIKRIYRLGILVGESSSGYMPKVDGPYYFFNALKNFLKLPNLIKHSPFFPMPIDPKALFPIIPVDQAAKLIGLSVLGPKTKNKTRTYHVVSSPVPNMQEFATDSLRTFGIRGKLFPLPRISFIGSVLSKFGVPEELLDYMFARVDYSQKNTLADFPFLKDCRYQDYKKNLFQYAKSHKIGRRG